DAARVEAHHVGDLGLQPQRPQVRPGRHVPEFHPAVEYTAGRRQSLAVRRERQRADRARVPAPGPQRPARPQVPERNLTVHPPPPPTRRGAALPPGPARCPPGLSGTPKPPGGWLGGVRMSSPLGGSQRRPSPGTRGSAAPEPLALASSLPPGEKLSWKTIPRS